MQPPPNTQNPAPAKILNTMSCGCTKGCTGRCNCRKGALFEDEGKSHMPIAVEAEIGEDSPFEDDPDAEGLYIPLHLERSFCNKNLIFRDLIFSVSNFPGE